MYDKVSLFIGTVHRDTDGTTPTFEKVKSNASYAAEGVATRDAPAVVGELVYKAVRDFPRPLAVLAAAAVLCHHLDGGPGGSAEGQAAQELNEAAHKLLDCYEAIDEQRRKKPCG